MSSRLAVVVSPRSRRFRNDPGAIDRVRRIAGSDVDVSICNDSESTRAAVERARQAGVTVIAVAGGDGTAGHVIAQLRETWGETPWPSIALIRGGTMNTVANGLGLSRGSPEDLLKRLGVTLAAAHADGRPPATIERPTIDVAGRLGFLFGTGVFYNFLEAYYAKGNGDPTVVTAAQTIAQTVASILVGGALAKRIGRLVPLTVEADGEIWPERRFLAVNAGTVTEVGLGFRAFHLAHHYRQAFHLMGLTASASDVVFDLPRVWLGQGVRGKHGRNVVARTVTLTPPSGTAIDYMVDGDLFSSMGQLHLTTGPMVSIVRF